MLQWVILSYTCSPMSSTTSLQYHGRKPSGGSIVVITIFMLLFAKTGSVHSGREHGFKSRFSSAVWPWMTQLTSLNLNFTQLTSWGCGEDSMK